MSNYDISEKEANTKLADMVRKIEESIEQAEEFVKQYPDYDLTFRLRPAYGMGGTYGRGFDEKDTYSWLSSSANC